MLTVREQAYKVKSLKKESRKAENQPLRAYFEREHRKELSTLLRMQRNESGYVTPRSPWKRLQGVYEVQGQ